MTTTLAASEPPGVARGNRVEPIDLSLEAGDLLATPSFPRLGMPLAVIFKRGLATSADS